jgi:hypothetical protein
MNDADRDRLLADIDGKVNRIIGSLMGDSTAPNKLGLIDTVRKHEVQISMLQTAENRCSVRRTLDTHLQEHEKAPAVVDVAWRGVCSYCSSSDAGRLVCVRTSPDADV